MMRSSGASGREPESASSDSCDEFASGSVPGSDEAIDIRRRLGERPSSNCSGGDDCGIKEESNSIGSGKTCRAAGDADGEFS
jgi:hypothetical protein